jgi:hypothetical protein
MGSVFDLPCYKGKCMHCKVLGFKAFCEVAEGEITDDSLVSVIGVDECFDYKPRLEGWKTILLRLFKPRNC